MEPPSILVDSQPAYARIFGVLDTSGGWTESGPLPKDATSVEAVITKLPFFIGRLVPSGKDGTEFLSVNSSKISREHAVINWDYARGVYTLRCLSKNGLDANREYPPLVGSPVRGRHWLQCWIPQMRSVCRCKHSIDGCFHVFVRSPRSIGILYRLALKAVAIVPCLTPLMCCCVVCAGARVDIDESVILPSQSTVRIGPFYFYFLLPVGVSQTMVAALPGGAHKSAADRHKYNIRALIDEVRHSAGCSRVPCLHPR